MNKSFDLIQLFYEIAMSIGLTLDLEKMLKVSMMAYLKNLNCTAGSILHCRQDNDGHFYFKEIYLSPLKFHEDPVYQQTLNKLSNPFNNESVNNFRSKLPLIGGDSISAYYHLLDLPGFGLLLLVHPEQEINTQIIKSINPLNAKLAVACNACLQDRELRSAHRHAIDINRQLHHKTLELEKSQNALRESETKYRTIFENTQDVFYQTDLSGKILEISPSISRYSNFNRNQLLGKQVTEIYHQSADHQRLLSILRERREVEDFECRLQNKSGQQVLMSINAHLVNGENRKPIAIEGSMRDVTMRKQAEEALRESDKLKSDFVSSVSHELRTPLASILGFSSTILRDKRMNGDTKEEFIKIIYQESQRLSKLIEDILNISKIESGRITYRLRQIDLEPLIAEIIDVHRIQANEKGVELEHQFSHSPVKIFADADSMKQVFSNLFGNAIKFTAKGGKILVHLYKEQQQAVFEISDNGIGIPQKEQDKIFNKFYRVYRPGMETKGTGLGLSIVKEILDAHNTLIKVESEENKGTTFRLRFPQNNTEDHNE